MITILSTQYWKMYRYTLMYMVIVLVFACKSEPQQTVEEPLFKKEIPQDFLDFYDRFHNDLDYQLDHIVFPLRESSDSTLWHRSEWDMHKPFDTSGGEFTRNYTHLNGIVVEVIEDQKGIYRIERRFTKKDEGYDLIYYKVINAFENSDFEKVIE